MASNTVMDKLTHDDICRLAGTETTYSDSTVGVHTKWYEVFEYAGQTQTGPTAWFYRIIDKAKFEKWAEEQRAVEAEKRLLNDEYHDAVNWVKNQVESYMQQFIGSRLPNDAINASVASGLASFCETMKQRGDIRDFLIDCNASSPNLQIKLAMPNFTQHVITAQILP